MFRSCILDYSKVFYLLDTLVAGLVLCPLMVEKASAIGMGVTH